VFFLNTSLSFKAWANYSLRSRRIKGRGWGGGREFGGKKRRSGRGEGKKEFPPEFPPPPLYTPATQARPTKAMLDLAKGNSAAYFSCRVALILTALAFNVK